MLLLLIGWVLIATNASLLAFNVRRLRQIQRVNREARQLLAELVAEHYTRIRQKNE